MQLTAGQSFYHRFCRAIESGDLDAVESFYRPDAVLASLSTRRTLQGRPVILASIKETVEAAGPVRPISVESFLEHGDMVCVEATQATRFAKVETYDMFLLRQGAIHRQFSGTISPRQPTASLTIGAPTTLEQQLVQRLLRAAESADEEALRSLYRPDAVLGGAGLGIVLEGRDAITEHIRKGRRSSDPGRFKGLISFVESPGVIGTESVRGYQFGGSGLIPDTDVLTSECFLVQDGAISYQFESVIAPRVEEIKALLESRAQAVSRARERSLDMFTFRNWRW
jgi:ketosteroid isomerase-like protein